LAERFNGQALQHIHTSGSHRNNNNNKNNYNYNKLLQLSFSQDMSHLILCCMGKLG